ncbi:MAG: hypothetical protein EHM41_19220 [Chloroflexi bacterium]|nr:MAG: hypothetical protein EHM41_19220 [Chloroflexota bacterium]
MASYASLPQKPDKVQAIAIMILVNGILNIMYGIIFTLVVIFGSFFLGVVCAPLTILPTVLGIFEVIYATKLIPTYPTQPVKPTQTIPILEIVAILSGNFVSLIVGILNLVFFNDPEVEAYFAALNAQTSPPQTIE